MADVQEPDLVFRWNGWVHFNGRGRQFSRLLAAEVCPSAFIVGSNAGYTMFRGSVKGTGYSPHSSFSPSLPFPYVTVCQLESTARISCRLVCMWQLSFAGHETARSVCSWDRSVTVRMRKKLLHYFCPADTSYVWLHSPIMQGSGQTFPEESVA